jgi:glycosyltransferase involved in cell wall biosynthesis
MIKRVGLCMIVKNEAHVIERCLTSVAPLCDYMLLVDTGSSDGTQAIVRRFFDASGIAGDVIEEPWRDFAYNRSFALARLRQLSDIDYSLMIDADEVLVYDTGFDAAAFKAELTADIYDIRTKYGGIDYLRPQLCNNRLAFSYRGVLHEFLEAPPGELSRSIAQGLHNWPVQDGARGSDPEKFRKDAVVLAAAAEEEPDPWLASRYQFYLAQSYRDAGEPALALAAYEARAVQGYWDEEVFCAGYEIGRLRERLGRPAAEILAAYLDAYNACPRRAESLHAAARFTRLRDQHHLAYMLAKTALSIPRPDGGLFVETWIYDYGLLDEFSIAAYWAGHVPESLEACDTLLSGGKLPVEHRARVIENRQFAEDRLREAASA